MKVCAIGDFHGRFPMKLRSRIKKEKPDLIVSVGDFFPFSYSKIWFEHCYKKILVYGKLSAKRSTENLNQKIVEKAKR